MTLRVLFHPLASAEVVNAQLWYEQRAGGLGDRFLLAVRAVTDRAARWPDAATPARTTEDRVVERQVATPGFPYVVVYRVAHGTLQVLAVHHQQRQPEYWVDRTA